MKGKRKSGIGDECNNIGALFDLQRKRQKELQLQGIEYVINYYSCMHSMNNHDTVGSKKHPRMITYKPLT
jgi:hypothetical protein